MSLCILYGIRYDVANYALAAPATMAVPLAAETDAPTAQLLWHAGLDLALASDPETIADAAILCGHSLDLAAACPVCVASPAAVAH